MPQASLKLVTGNSYYLDSRLSIGVYVLKNNKVVLIDSGIDNDTAKSVEKALAALNKNYSIGAIINTHSHADHCGGNSYFQKKNPNIKIFSTKFEKPFIEMPQLEPTCFCSGAAPFAELCNKHLQAQPSNVTNVIEDYKDQAIDIDNEQFTIITLPGHTPGSIGVITPDNVLYCGDALFGEETFCKHGVLFYTDINKTLSSLEKVASLKVDCVFYHGGLLEKEKALAGIAKEHQHKIMHTYDIIYAAIKEKSYSLDDLTQFVMTQFKIPQSVMQFTLTRTCVNAYVTQLQLDKKIQLDMQDGLMVIKSTEASHGKDEVSEPRRAVI